MTRSSRTGNRILLALIGLAALGLAGLVAAPLVAPTLEQWGVALPTWVAPPTETSTLGLIITLASCALVVVIAIAWIATRGRGRTRTALTSGDGSVQLDVHLVRDLIKAELSGNPDVTSVSAAAYRRRGTTALRLHVEARRGAELRRLVAGIETAFDRVVELIGERPPALVHISSGLRASLSKSRRTI